jgi:hypothetical protein
MPQYLEAGTLPSRTLLNHSGQAYFAHTDVRAVRDELKLNRPDVGWYQIRKALQARNASGDFPPVSFKPFETAYKSLTEKLQPQVYELGFLRL